LTTFSGNAGFPARSVQDGILVFVRLTPRASSDQVIGLKQAADGTAHIAARVRAVPEKGAANAAVTRLFAKWLAVAKSDISLQAGATSRLKTLHLRGDPQELLSALRKRLARA
jgi:uncharacterized protein YggU (UPF0235/DUF167 family)